MAVVVLENHGPDALAGPRLAALLRGAATATRAYGEVHPSLGNYLALLSGSNQGVSDDDVSRRPFDAPSLAGQLDAAGISWRAYMNGMPSPCFGGADHGRYVERHNPFMFFRDALAGCRTHVLPGPPRLPLPRFTWITPDLCQDMHDCDVAAGQRWLAGALPPLLRGLGPHGVLFVTADEGTEGAGGGRIPLVALGRGVRPGARLALGVSHRNLLATVQDVLGLPRLPTTRGLATLRPLLRG